MRPNPPPVRGPGQKDPIVVGSPLAIVGIFVAVLRERFAPGNGPEQWPWEEDLTKTGIVIESGFATLSLEEKNKKPAIFVDKDESVYGKMIIGDRVGVKLRNMLDAQWTLSTVPIVIECVSDAKGESAVIGDITQWTIHASSDAIQGAFSLHDMSPPVLGRTVPYESDKESWVTPVSFQVQYNVRWTTVPIAPILRELRARVHAVGDGGPHDLGQVADAAGPRTARNF